MTSFTHQLNSPVEWVFRVTRRKLQTPGTVEEHKRQETPTINPNDRQPTQLTDQAPGTIERAARESRHTTPISTAAVHAFSTTTTRHQHPHATGTSPDPLSQRCESQAGSAAIHHRHHPPQRGHTAPTLPGRPSSGVGDGQPRAHGLLLRPGKVGGDDR